MKVKKVDWTFNKVSSEASGEVLNDVSSINKKAKQQISGEQHHTTQHKAARRNTWLCLKAQTRVSVDINLI